MIKVLRIIARLNIGGPAIHTILLSNALNRNGYKDILVCGRVSEHEGDMMYLARRMNVKPVVVPELGRDISFGKDLRAFLRLFAIIRRERPDIVHTHTAKAGTLGRLAAVLAGVPVKVHTFHGHIFDGYFSPLRARVFLWIERILALFTDRIITVSDRVRDDIVYSLKVTHGAKSQVIPLGFDLEQFLKCDKSRGRFRKRFGIDNDTALVGIVGRLVPIKNHRMFLDVASRVRREVPRLKVKFVIVGDGEMRGVLEEHARGLHLGEDVLFTGWIEDLADVYADLDVVALTSLNEGTPVSVIEAMAAGKAVIATDVGGVPDVCEDGLTGILAKRNDVGDYTSKLIALLNDAERRGQLGARARDHVKEKYSKERLVRDIEALYEGLVDQKLRKRKGSRR